VPAIFAEDALKEREIITLNRRDPVTATTIPVIVHRCGGSAVHPRETPVMLADA
jgi:hypothetical protein